MLGVTTADLGSVLSALPVGVVVVDDDDTLVVINPAAQSLLGWNRLEASLVAGTLLVDGSGRPVQLEDSPLAESRRTRRPVSAVLGVATQPGAAPRWVRITAVPGGTGDSRWTVCVVEPGAPPASEIPPELVLEALMAVTQDGVALLGPSGALLACNDRVLAMFDLERAGAFGEPSFFEPRQPATEDGLLLPPSEWPCTIALTRGISFRDGVLRLCTSTGAHRWVRITAAPLPPGGMPPIAALCTLTDITEQRRMASDLSEGRKLLSVLTDTGPSGAFQFRRELDGGERFTFASQEFASLVGVARDALLEDAKHFWNRVHPVDLAGLRANIDAGARDLQIRPIEFRLGREGDYRWVRSRSVPSRDADGVAWNGLLTDVAEEKALGEALRRAQRLDVVGSLAAGVAHNFNNALGAIVPNVDHCLDLAPPELVPALRDIRAAAHGAADLVRQLLLVARRDESQAHVALDLGASVRRALDVCRRTFPREVTIRCEIADGEYMVRGRESQLEQVVLNLCLNARDALGAREAPELSVTLDTVDEATRLHPSARPATAYHRLCVIDNGSGIPTDIQARLGEPFFTTKPPGRGTGLGLATTFGILRDHGGWLAIESEQGRGSIFTVFLPAASLARDYISSTPAPPLVGRGRPLRVLIIDDEVLVRRALTRVLVRHAFEVTEATGGGEGVARFEADPDGFDAVIVDLSMPGVSGPEVLARLRALRSDTPMVVLSGHVPDPSAVIGASRVLQKPIATRDLLRHLRELCAAVPSAPTKAT